MGKRATYEVKSGGGGLHDLGLSRIALQFPLKVLHLLCHVFSHFSDVSLFPFEIFL